MKILYYITYGIFYAISLLPFSILYVISDVFSFLVGGIIGYRKKVIRKNLRKSFPEKSEAELRKIEKDFYRWMCDYFVETIKLLSMSKEKMARHIVFENIEEVNECFDKGISCAAILGHYCNWEWLSATPIGITNDKAVCGLIYHPLYNATFDKVFIKIRESMGGVCIPKKDILRYLRTYSREKRPSLFGYISDQSPKWENIHLWLPFMHQDTPVFTGGERIMQMMNNAVFYVDMSRPVRGRYICRFVKIADDAAATEKFEITKKFYIMLDETIRRAPQYYLWSHNRWKRTHEEFNKRFTIENGHNISKTEK